MSSVSKPPSSLADRTARGVIWFALQSVVARFVGLVAQLLLAKLLLKEEFGFYGLALTVHSFASLFYQGGVPEVLIQRRKSFDRWSNAAFWLSIVLGTSVGLITFLLAPLVSAFYQTDSPAMLTELIRILAIAFPVSAIGTVSRARIQAQLRFRLLAVIESGRVVVDACAKIALAWLGFGAYSFAYAIVGVTIVAQVVYLFAAPPGASWQPQVRRWKYLAGTGSKIIAAAIFYWVISQGDYVVLGRFGTVEAVGLYFFAFSISQHTRDLLTQQLTRVLFPALSHLPQDRQVQVAAFLRAARMMAVAAVPICIGQAAIAGPLIRLLFEPRWHDAIPLIQVMCLGMVLSTIIGPAASLLQAQGRFGTRLRLSAISAGMFIPLAVAGAWTGSPIRLAVFVAAFWCLVALLDLTVAVWPVKPLGTALREIYRMPATAGIVSVGSAYYSIQLLERYVPLLQHDLVKLIWIIAWSAALYVAIVRTLAPDLLAELLSRVGRTLPGRWKHRATENTESHASQNPA